MATAQFITIIFSLSEIQMLSYAVREVWDEYVLRVGADGSEAPEFGWLEVVGECDHVQVVDVFGDRLFVVDHSRADWGLVCTYLAKFAWNREGGADDDTPEGRFDLAQADFAWAINAQISEAIL